MLARSVALTTAVAAIVAATVLALRPQYQGTRAGHADADYLRSTTCRSCHPDHYASWARTFHRRMTQEARPDSVQGDFGANGTFDYLGIRARMETRAGRFSMTLQFPDGRLRSFSVDRTVGSRRVEQYLTKQPGGYTRLPLAYDLTNRRWVSLNGAFFHPDGNNYFQHLAQWDANCVFCHNVKAQPHFDARTNQFQTEVAELGIACGACHGPAATHAEAATSPLTRTWWRLSDGPATRIINPRKLSPERSLMVCGHCHGQRVPAPTDRIQEILTKGDPYHAGDDLARFYRPVARETVIGHFSFANRFWSNGSPRLTAYEYQGILRSKCYLAGEPVRRINCLTCHSMHDGDPHGQITTENRTDRPCLACHKNYEGQASLTAHTGHHVSSTGSRCYTCHMPRVVYGIMSVHPTHEITSPDPTLTATQAVPNACNQCHLDKSVNWAIKAARRLWPARFHTAQLSGDAQFEVAEGPRALFAGDALTRALAAEALGGGPAQSDPGWAAPLLVEAFTDNYPIVRFFAAQSLKAGRWPAPISLDYLGTPENRQSALDRWWALFAPATRHEVVEMARMLRARRTEVDLEVGE